MGWNFERIQTDKFFSDFNTNYWQKNFRKIIAKTSKNISGISFPKTFFFRFLVPIQEIFIFQK